MRSLIFFLIVAAWMSGCAGRPSISENQCAAGDWQTIGYRDGVNGQRSSRLLAHQDACMEYGVVPGRQAYMTGWEDGAREYCDPNNGFHVGERGWSHNNICPADLRAGFLTAYHAGRALYDTRAEIADLEREIDRKTSRLSALKSEIISATTAQLDGTLTVEARVELAARVQKLYEEREQIRLELPDLEAELAAKSGDLDRLSQTVAVAAPQA